MKREVRMEEISDGKLYTANDLVKADCGDCEGCSACCRDMGTSIVLDPLDIHRLTGGLGVTFEQLLAKHVELNVVDGLILPNMKMSEEQNCCAFLDENGRCSVHALRPGICRLFPLGRFYENREFRYFLQTHECRKENRTKVKVKKWIDVPDFKQYEKYIKDWHYFLVDLQERLLRTADETVIKKINMLVLQSFFLEPYKKEEDFYVQFDERLVKMRQSVDVLLGLQE